MHANKIADFEFFISRRQVSTFLKVLVLLNLLFLAGTWAHHTGFFHFGKPTANIILSQFNLGRENVAASWYSSMLFLLTGLVALYCCWADWVRSDNNKGRALSFGWMVMAGIFILLSFDEMGSFHEMIGETSFFKSAGSAKRAGWYAFYAVCAAVALFMILFFVHRFRKNKMTLLLTIMGVLFFASNPVQEKFEIHSWRNAVDMSAWKRPAIYLLLEEGSEIFASFCFLFSFLMYAISASTVEGGMGIRFYARSGRLLIIVFSALLLILAAIKILIHLNAWNFTRDDNGIPRNWPPSMLFFIAFLAGIWANSYWKKCFRFAGLFLTVTALLSSLYFGANLYGYHGRGYDRSLFGLIPYALLGATTAVVILLSKLPGKFQVKLCWMMWLTGMALSVILRGSPKVVLTTFAGYFAASALLAGLYLSLVSRKSS